MTKVPIILALTIAGFATSSATTSPDSLNLTVKAIVVQGNEKTKDYVVLREMSIKVGDTLHVEAMAIDHDRIYSLGLFNKVEVYHSADSGQATVYVDVRERWYLFPFPVIGFRYRDLEKVYYGAGILHQNFRGRNEKLFFMFALGYDKRISLQYQNPKLTDDDVFLRFGISYGVIPNLSVTYAGDYEQLNFSTNLTLGKRYGLYQTIQGSIGYDVLQVSDIRAGRTVSSSGRDAYVYAGARYSYDSRDVREYPLSGTFFTVAGNKSGFGYSEVNTFTYGFDARQFFPLNGDLSLGMRSFGTFSGGGLIPPYHYVFYGYDERLRGYFDDIWEGENIMGGSAEIRIAIFKPRYATLSFIPVPEFSTIRYGLSAGIFVDGGKVWNRADPFLDRNWKSGYGAGIHFLLPYSVIVRTEYAFDNYGRGQFFIDIGTSF